MADKGCSCQQVEIDGVLRTVLMFLESQNLSETTKVFKEELQHKGLEGMVTNETVVLQQSPRVNYLSDKEEHCNQTDLSLDPLRAYILEHYGVSGHLKSESSEAYKLTTQASSSYLSDCTCYFCTSRTETALPSNVEVQELYVAGTSSFNSRSNEDEGRNTNCKAKRSKFVVTNNEYEMKKAKRSSEGDSCEKCVSCHILPSEEVITSEILNSGIINPDTGTFTSGEVDERIARATMEKQMEILEKFFSKDQMVDIKKSIKKMDQEELRLKLTHLQEDHEKLLKAAKLVTEALKVRRNSKEFETDGKTLQKLFKNALLEVIREALPPFYGEGDKGRNSERNEPKNGIRDEFTQVESNQFLSSLNESTQFEFNAHVSTRDEGTQLEASQLESSRVKSTQNASTQLESSQLERACGSTQHESTQFIQESKDKCTQLEFTQLGFAQNEFTQNEVTQSEFTRDEFTQNDITQNEFTQNEFARNESTQSGLTKDETTQLESNQNEWTQLDFFESQQEPTQTYLAQIAQKKVKSRRNVSIDQRIEIGDSKSVESKTQESKSREKIRPKQKEPSRSKPQTLGLRPQTAVPQKLEKAGAPGKLPKRQRPHSQEFPKSNKTLPEIRGRRAENSDINRLDHSDNSFEYAEIELPDDPNKLPWFELNYNALKLDLYQSNPKEVSRILQALRWRITKTKVDQRNTSVNSFVHNDLLDLVGNGFEKTKGESLLKNLYFTKKSVEVQENVSRLINALASLTCGRDYLTKNDALLVGVIFPLLFSACAKASASSSSISSSLPFSSPSSLQPSSLQPSSLQPSSLQPSSVQNSSLHPSSFHPSSLQSPSLQPSLFSSTSFPPSAFSPPFFGSSSKDPKTEDKVSKVTLEHSLATLQKLSLRKNQRILMIKCGVVDCLLSYLIGNYEDLSPYCIEYSTALLMNLSLHEETRVSCRKFARKLLELYEVTLSGRNPASLPYLNGAVYSLLTDDVINEEAKSFNLEQVLGFYLEKREGEVRKQLEIILKLHKQRVKDEGCVCNEDGEPEEEFDLLEPELEHEAGDFDSSSRNPGEVFLERYRKKSGGKHFVKGGNGNFGNTDDNSEEVPTKLGYKPLSVPLPRGSSGQDGNVLVDFVEMDILREKLRSLDDVNPAKGATKDVNPTKGSTKDVNPTKGVTKDVIPTKGVTKDVNLTKGVPPTKNEGLPTTKNEAKSDVVPSGKNGSYSAPTNQRKLIIMVGKRRYSLGEKQQVEDVSRLEGFRGNVSKESPEKDGPEKESPRNEGHPEKDAENKQDSQKKIAASPGRVNVEKKEGENRMNQETKDRENPGEGNRKEEKDNRKEEKDNRKERKDNRKEEKDNRKEEKDNRKEEKDNRKEGKDHRKEEKDNRKAEKDDRRAEKDDRNAEKNNRKAHKDNRKAEKETDENPKKNGLEVGTLTEDSSTESTGSSPLLEPIKEEKSSSSQENPNGEFSKTRIPTENHKTGNRISTEDHKTRNRIPTEDYKTRNRISTEDDKTRIGISTEDFDLKEAESKRENRIPTGENRRVSTPPEPPKARSKSADYPQGIQGSPKFYIADFLNSKESKNEESPQILPEIPREFKAKEFKLNDQKIIILRRSPERKMSSDQKDVFFLDKERDEEDFPKVQRDWSGEMTYNEETKRLQRRITKDRIFSPEGSTFNLRSFKGRRERKFEACSPLKGCTNPEEYFPRPLLPSLDREREERLRIQSQHFAGSPPYALDYYSCCYRQNPYQQLAAPYTCISGPAPSSSSSRNRYKCGCYDTVKNYLEKTAEYLDHVGYKGSVRLQPLNKESSFQSGQSMNANGQSINGNPMRMGVKPEEIGPTDFPTGETNFPTGQKMFTSGHKIFSNGPKNLSPEIPGGESVPTSSQSEIQDSTYDEVFLSRPKIIRTPP